MDKAKPKLSALSQDAALRALFSAIEDGSLPIGEPRKPRHFKIKRHSREQAAKLTANPIPPQLPDIRDALRFVALTEQRTTDRVARLKQARDDIGAGVREIGCQPNSVKGRNEARAAFEPHRVAMIRRRGETDLAVAFILLGHALGVEHPESLLKGGVS